MLPVGSCQPTISVGLRGVKNAAWCSAASVVRSSPQSHGDAAVLLEKTVSRSFNANRCAR